MTMTKPLKREIKKTLNWFAEIDIKRDGKISDSTKQAFRKQKISIPKKFKEK